MKAQRHIFLFSLVAVSLMLAGCASSNARWIHPRPKKVNLQKDLKECKANAKREDPGAGEVLALGIGMSYYAKNAEEWNALEKCMNEKGYTADLN